MSDIAIRVENLGKRYHIGETQTRYKTLRESLMTGLHNLRSRQKNESERLIWALKDVSFEVKRGEAIGVIGRNGAGKSTLLKVLAHITRPTTGRVEIHGRVGSLLEVGTGFHPELTGRDNIYLNGAILGMKRAEIERKFDEIVAFAEIEKFLDTPVKHYSSGMYMRLAFAVAAHLEPEILLVDEVLAVGDAAFQKKCLGKMGEVTGEGRTVLFVSHNMPTITRLCNRAIFMHQGSIVDDGPAIKTSSEYIMFGRQTSAIKVWAETEAPGDDIAKLKSVRILNTSGNPAEYININEETLIELEYWNYTSKSKTTAIIHLVSEDGTTIFASNDWNNKEWWHTPRAPGIVKSTCKIPGNFLADGRFFVLVAIGSYNPNIIHAIEREAVSFSVIDMTNGIGVRGDYSGGYWPGVIRPWLEWDVKFESNN